jgi:O-antigen/teichoic acid export membrane protein
VTHGLKIPAALQAETVNALRVLCLSIPFVTCTAGLRGMLEARQRFGPVNVIRATLGVLTFLGPIAILPFSSSLEPVMWLLLAVRVVAWGASVALCAGSFPGLRRGIAMRRDMVAPLFTAGGWITVSNIVGPVITYLDRFLIGALLSAAAVAYYVTPYEVVTKFLIFPTALAAVLFPAFAAGGADARHVASLYSSALKYVLLFMYPAALIVVAVAPEAMSWWLGSEFPSQGAEVARVLTVGVLLNALAYVPYALAQAVGRADWVARLHLVELAVYVPLLYAAVEAAGIVGAAIAWSARVAIDFAALVAIGRRLLPRGARSLRLPWSAGIACCALLAAAWLIPGFAERALLAAAGCAVFATLSWKHWLSPDEKAGLATWAVTARDRPGGGA